MDCSIDYLLTGSEKTEYKIISSIEYAAKTGDKSKLDTAVKLSTKDDKGIAFIQYIDKYNKFEFFEEEINKINNRELDVIREYLSPRILEWLIVLHRELDVFTRNSSNFYKRGTIRNWLSFNDGSIGEIKFPVDKTLYDNRIHHNSIATYKDLFKLLIIHFDDLDESQKKDYFGLSCTDFVKPENCWASAYPYFLHYAYMLNKKAFDILIKRVASIEEYKKEEERIKLDQSYNSYSRMNTLKKFKGGRPLEKTLDLAIKQNDTKYIKILNQYFNFDDFEIRKRAINQDESLTPDEKLYETIFRNGVVDLNSITKFSDIKYAIKALQQGYLTEYEMVSDKLAHKQFKEIYKFFIDKNLTECADLLVRKEYDKILPTFLRNHYEPNSRILTKLSVLIHKSSQTPVELLPCFFEVIKKNGHYYDGNGYMSIYGNEKEFRAMLISELKREKERETIIKNYESSSSEITPSYIMDLISKNNTDLAIIKLCVKLEAIFTIKFNFYGDLKDMILSYEKQYPYNGYYQGSTFKEKISLLDKLRQYRNSIAHPVTKAEKPTFAELQNIIEIIFSL